MKVKELLARAGPDAEIFVKYDHSEDELAIEAMENGAIRVEMHKGQRRVVFDYTWYAGNIYGDSDQ